ncbi:MAG TPA: glycosyltransferase family 39 protein [Pyrinomonadaceae bacterium]|nr:glycosyltransferase family 39 protein [Pyrinomonadaceae bacterium]
MPLPYRPLIICGLVLLALGVRFLTWQDNRRDIWKIQTSVTDGYKDSARQLASGDLKLFVSDINQIGHPPGYPILLAVIFKTFGDSNTAIHFVQIVMDCVSVVLLFLIALKVVPFTAAVLCGFLAAISPQFAYFSVVLLPDSLVVPPILLAVLFLIRGRHFAIAGALIGVSCLLRANAFLLPFFLALLTPLFVRRGKRLHAAAALIGGALLVIAPVTIKNAIVFRSFIPLSLGAGQTFLEGIADYDHDKRFNIPNTDLGLMRQEAEWYGKPEYARLLFGRDGVERDRMRIERGLAVVRDHPFWFAGVVARRGLASTRLDPVPVLNPEPPVSYQIPSFPVNEELTPVAPQHHNYAVLHVSETKDVNTNTDCVAYVPLKLEKGRLQIKITDEKQKTVLASTNIDLVEGVPASEQPIQNLAMPFVSANHSQVRLVITNFAAHDSAVLIGTSRVVELGPSLYQWLRYVRQPIAFLQRFFKTAWILPFLVLGLFLMVRKHDLQSLAILLAVPAYYLAIQSTLHTERRYVYIIHFFFLIFVSVALWKISTLAYAFGAGFLATHKPETPKGRFM